MKDLHIEDVIAAAEATGTYDGYLRRAMDEAPKLLIAGGLSQPFNSDLSYDGYQATEQVMGEDASMDSEASYRGLVADAMPGSPALINAFAKPRINAAYALGLAVGLTFGRLMARGPLAPEEV